MNYYKRICNLYFRQNEDVIDQFIYDDDRKAK